LPRNAGRFPPGTQGNTCQPRTAAASAARATADSARLTSAALTLNLFLEKLLANPKRALQGVNRSKRPSVPRYDLAPDDRYGVGASAPEGCARLRSWGDE
jgi:hypothetical protein